MTSQRTGLTIIKVGGKIVETPDSLERLLDSFAAVSGHKVLVHGGGRSATSIASRLGIETVMIDGRRVTDAAMLDVVTMVYGGLVNKKIVARLQARGVNALGLTGADLDSIRSRRRDPSPVDYGYVGDVTAVNAEMLRRLLDADIVPVIAPLTHDGCGSMLNTNADTMAAETAKALAGYFDVTLIYCFEKPGVLADGDDDTSVIADITPALYRRLRADGVVNGGMIPKLDNAFRAIYDGVSRVVIKSADDIADPSLGTTIHL